MNAFASRAGCRVKDITLRASSSRNLKAHGETSKMSLLVWFSSYFFKITTSQELNHQWFPAGCHDVPADTTLRSQQACDAATPLSEKQRAREIVFQLEIRCPTNFSLSWKVEKGLGAETRDNLKGVETNWWNVDSGIYCWERGRLVRIERGARTSGSEGTLTLKQRTE